MKIKDLRDNYHTEKKIQYNNYLMLRVKPTKLIGIYDYYFFKEEEEEEETNQVKYVTWNF